MDYGINLATAADSWKVVKRAEELGFTRAWFYDTQLLNAEIFVAMGAAAVTTTRIRLGTGVLIPSNRIAPVAASALMARVPHGGLLVDNPVSVAPGFQMENVFTFAGIPKVAEAMFQSMKHRLVGGTPVLSRTVRTNLPEGIIAEPLGALQKRYDDLDIGSYPAFRNGKPSVSLVLRGTDDARLAAAATELMDTIRKMNGEAEEFAQ